MSKNQNKNGLIYGILLITFFSAGILFILLQYANRELDRTINQSIKNVSHEQQMEINLQLETAENSLLSLANSISEIEMDDEESLHFLSEQNRYNQFENMFYVDIAGMGLSDVGETVDLSHVIDFSGIVENKVSVTMPYSSEVSQNEVIGFQAPLTNQNGVYGFLYGEFSLDYFAQNLSDADFQNGYSLISYPQGGELFVSNENYIPFSELAPSLEQAGIAPEDILQDFEDGQERVFFFNYQGRELVASYVPLAFNDWSLVFVGEKKYMESELRTLSIVLIVSAMIVFVGLMLFALYSWNARKKVEYVAYYDELTGLANLNKFKKHVSEYLKKNPDKPSVAVKMDVDNFKAINELYGFETGDKVIVAFVGTGERARQVEPSFFLARTGVDEFMMFSANGFLEKLGDLTEQYEGYFKKLIPQLEKHHLSFCYGRYFIEPGENNVNDIVSKTSMAHSIAKSKRDGLVWDYDEEYKKRLLVQADLINKVHNAMKTGEIVPYLQPKVELKSQDVVGAEALVRWIEKDGNIIFPDSFVPLFESNGFIVDIDKHILRSVCQTLKNWMEAGLCVVPISVNFSRRHLDNPRLFEDIVEIVDGYNLAHELIEIEFTETVVAENEAKSEKLFLDLQNANFKVSIDDFGTGYSSLGTLRNFSANTLKLDKSFFDEREGNEKSNTVIDGIIKLAHSINMHVLAEGIEEETQVEFLKTVNCEAVQGYFYSRPLPIEQFTESFIKREE